MDGPDPTTGAAALPPALRALAEALGSLLGHSAGGRVLLGRAAGWAAPEALPPGLRGVAQRLEHARSEASQPLDAKAVDRTLRGAWGRPVRRVLDDLDLAVPVAVTPIAQVHRAALDGEPVAVKVRRPGLEATVRADLTLLDALRPPLTAAFPTLDAGAVLAQIRERALDELDFEHEATQQRAAGRALRRTPGVEVPASRLELSAPEVLVSSWLDGPSLADRRPADPGAAARALVAAHLDAARAGLVLIDPRPNHVVLLGDGRIGLLGTGAAVPGDRGRLMRLVGLLAALGEPDGDAFAAGVMAAPGLLPGDAEARAAHALLRAVLGPLATGPARLDGAAFAGAAGRALPRLGEGLGLAAATTLDPRDLWPARGIAQLLALLAVLGADADWIALTRGDPG